MTVFSSIDDPRLVPLLAGGHVGVLPTDTIYGLAVRAADKSAAERLYSLKRRERKPGTIIAASIAQLVDLGLDEQSVKSVAHLWPNPLSVVLPVTPEKLSYLDQGVGSLAVRVPKDAKLRELLQKTGPLLTSSANHPGQQPADNIKEARNYFGDQVDFYVDGGDLSGRPPSTVARLINGKLQVLREGAVSARMLRKSA